jgi:hypothetical protein
MSAEQLATPVDFLGAFRLPSAFYLQFLNNHSIRHRGELATYLRPMGSKVPQIYGAVTTRHSSRQPPRTAPHSEYLARAPTLAKKPALKSKFGIEEKAGRQGRFSIARPRQSRPDTS